MLLFYFLCFNRWYPQSNINIPIFIYIQLSHIRAYTTLDEGFSLWLHIAVLHIINLRWFVCFIYKMNGTNDGDKTFCWKKMENELKKINTWFRTVTVWFIAIFAHKKIESPKINKSFATKSIRMLCHSIWVLGFCHFYAKTKQFYHSLYDIIVSSINSFMKCSHFSNFAF